jgi:hypothetical protein
MKLHFVKTMDDVLALSLESPLPEIAEETPTIAALPSTPELPTAHQ